jgi:hypothetical protein
MSELTRQSYRSANVWEDLHQAASWARSGADHIDAIKTQLIADVERWQAHYADIKAAAEEALGFWGIESDEGYQEAMRDLRRAVDIANEREKEAQDVE